MFTLSYIPFLIIIAVAIPLLLLFFLLRLVLGFFKGKSAAGEKRAGGAESRLR